jgi:hypothetical protein
MLTKPNDLFTKVCAIKNLSPEKLPKAGEIKCINDHYSVMPKNTTILTGYPSSGKSYLLMNFQMSMSVRFGHKHVLFSPEMGDPEWVMMTLLEIASGMRAQNLTEGEISHLLNWMQDKFLILSCDITPKLSDIDKDLAEAEKMLGHINTFSIDNLNDMRHDITGTNDIYYEQWLLDFNGLAHKYNCHGFLTAHPLSSGQIDDMMTPPEPRRIKGGGAFWNKGYNILSLAREEQYCRLAFYKIKPRIVGKMGMVDFRVDFSKNTYCAAEGFGDKYLFKQFDLRSKPKQTAIEPIENYKSEIDPF